MPRRSIDTLNSDCSSPLVSHPPPTPGLSSETPTDLQPPDTNKIGAAQHFLQVKCLTTVMPRRSIDTVHSDCSSPLVSHPPPTPGLPTETSTDPLWIPSGSDLLTLRTLPVDVPARHCERTKSLDALKSHALQTTFPRYCNVYDYYSASDDLCVLISTAYQLLYTGTLIATTTTTSYEIGNTTSKLPKPSSRVQHTSRCKLNQTNNDLNAVCSCYTLTQYNTLFAISGIIFTIAYLGYYYYNRYMGGTQLNLTSISEKVPQSESNINQCEIQFDNPIDSIDTVDFATSHTPRLHTFCEEKIFDAKIPDHPYAKIFSSDRVGVPSLSWRQYHACVPYDRLKTKECRIYSEDNRSNLQLQAATRYYRNREFNWNCCPRPDFDSVLVRDSDISTFGGTRPISYSLALLLLAAALTRHSPSSSDAESGADGRSLYANLKLNSFLLRLLFVTLFSGYRSKSVSKTAHGTANKSQQDVSAKGHSSSNSSGSNRNLVTSRPSLRRSRDNTTGRNEDDDDDENWRRNNTTPTGPQSACRSNIPLLLPPESDSDSAADTDYESDSSLAIMRAVAQQPNQTVLGGISRMIGGLGRGLYSFSLFGAQQDENYLSNIPNTSFALNVSIEHADDSPNGSSNPIISSTKLSSPTSRKKSTNSGLFLQVTPIRGKLFRKRAKSESNRSYNQAYYKPPSKLVRERAKLKVESDFMRQRSFSDPQPYAPHDSAISEHEISFFQPEELDELSKNISKIKPGISDMMPVPTIVLRVPEDQYRDQEHDVTFSGLANPDISPVSSRRRKNSLSLSPRSSGEKKSPCSLQKQTPRNTMSCVHIIDNGYHELRGVPNERCFIHLQQCLLEDATYDKAIVFSAVEKVLFKSFREIGSPSSVNPLQQSVTLSWNTDEVLAATKLAAPLEDDPTTEDSLTNVDNCLLHVLGELNRHARKLAMTDDQLDVVYNGLSITSMIDRNTRHPVNKLVDLPVQYPLITMHLGLERSVDAISKKFGSSLNEVYAISLGNFSTISILPEARATYNFTLPAEGSGIGNSDFHVFLSPTIEIQPKCDPEQMSVSADAPPGDDVMDITVIEMNQESIPSEAVDKSAVEVPPVYSAENTSPDKSSVENPLRESIPSEALENPLEESIPPEAVLKPDTDVKPKEDTICAEEDEKSTVRVIPAYSATETSHKSPKDTNPTNQADTEDKPTIETFADATRNHVEETIPTSPDNSEHTTSVEAQSKSEAITAEAVIKPGKASSHAEPPVEAESADGDAMPLQANQADPLADTARGFIQEPIYESIINSLSSKTCKAWAKECDIPRCATATDVKKLLTKRIESALNRKATLPMKFLEKLVGKMNDSAVQVELFNFSIRPKDGAKARKNQLVSHLCQRFSDVDLKEPNSTFSKEKLNLLQKSSYKSKKQQKQKQHKPVNQTKVARDPISTPVRNVSAYHLHPQTNIINCEKASGNPFKEPWTSSAPVKLQRSEEQTLSKAPPNAEHDSEEPIHVDGPDGKEKKRKNKQVKTLVVGQEKKQEDNTETHSSQPSSCEISKKPLVEDTISQGKRLCAAHLNENKTPQENTKVPLKILQDGLITLQSKVLKLEMNMNESAGQKQSSGEGSKLKSWIRDLEVRCAECINASNKQQSTMEEMTATLNQQKKELKTVTDKYSYLKGQITEMKTEFFLKLGSLADELDGMKMHRAAYAPGSHSEERKGPYMVDIGVITDPPVEVLATKPLPTVVDMGVGTEPRTTSTIQDEVHSVRYPQSLQTKTLIRQSVVSTIEELMKSGITIPGNKRVSVATSTSEADSVTGDEVTTAAKPSGKTDASIDETTEKVDRVDLATEPEPREEEKKKKKRSRKKKKNKVSQSEVVEEPVGSNNSPTINATDSEVIRKNTEKPEPSRVSESNGLSESRKERSTEPQESIQKKPPDCPVNTNNSQPGAARKPTLRVDDQTLGNRSQGYESKHKCLLVHDYFMSSFNKDRFTSWFDMDTESYRTLDVIRRRGSLISKIRSFKPAVVVLHVGFGDLYDGEHIDEVITSYKKIIYDILERTSTKVCISHMIPTPELRELDQKIFEVNRAVSSFVSGLRVNGDYRERAFSTYNNNLGKHITTSISASNNRRVTLEEHGQLKLWLSLRDSISRALGLIIAKPKPREISIDIKETSRTVHHHG